MSAGPPTRETVAGRAYLDLRRAARRDGRATDEYLRLYVLEGFLARLAASRWSRALVVKGGVLLAAYAVRRPTADIDVAARQVVGELEQVRSLVITIAEQFADDGIVFDTAAVGAEPIRDEDQYTGIRVSLAAALATARIRFHVDVNVGDPIWPSPGSVRLPRLLGGELSVCGYPLAMVLAEKIVTALERGSANTRWRDFADIYLISRAQPVRAGQLAEATRRVAEHRDITVRPLREALDGYAELGQAKWAAWRRKQGLEHLLPEPFDQVLTAVCAFADPVTRPNAPGGHWQPGPRQWDN